MNNGISKLKLALLEAIAEEAYGAWATERFPDPHDSLDNAREGDLAGR